MEVHCSCLGLLVQSATAWVMLQAPGPLAGKAVAPRTFGSYFFVRPSCNEQQQQETDAQASTSGRQHVAAFRSSHHALHQRELRQLSRRFHKTVTSNKARYSSTGLAAWTQRGELGACTHVYTASSLHAAVQVAHSSAGVRNEHGPLPCHMQAAASLPLRLCGRERCNGTSTP